MLLALFIVVVLLLFLSCFASHILFLLLRLILLLRLQIILRLLLLLLTIIVTGLLAPRLCRRLRLLRPSLSSLIIIMFVFGCPIVIVLRHHRFLGLSLINWIFLLLVWFFSV